MLSNRVQIPREQVSYNQNLHTWTPSGTTTRADGAIARLPIDDAANANMMSKLEVELLWTVAEMFLAEIELREALNSNNLFALWWRWVDGWSRWRSKVSQKGILNIKKIKNSLAYRIEYIRGSFQSKPWLLHFVNPATIWQLFRYVVVPRLQSLFIWTGHHQRYSMSIAKQNYFITSQHDVIHPPQSHQRTSN